MPDCIITLQQYRSIPRHKANLKKRRNNPAVKISPSVLMWYTPQTPEKLWRFSIDYKGMTVPTSQKDLRKLLL
jgi:hypothetical protein